jgi:hypothetical protein
VGSPLSLLTQSFSGAAATDATFSESTGAAMVAAATGPINRTRETLEVPQ